MKAKPSPSFFPPPPFFSPSSSLSWYCLRVPYGRTRYFSSLIYLLWVVIYRLGDLSLILPKMQAHLLHYLCFAYLELPQCFVHLDLNWVLVLTFFFFSSLIYHLRSTLPPTSPSSIFVNLPATHSCLTLTQSRVDLTCGCVDPTCHHVTSASGAACFLAWIFTFVLFSVAFIVFMYLFFCIWFVFLFFPFVCLTLLAIYKRNPYVGWDSLLLEFLLLDDKSCFVFCNASPLNLLLVVVVLT